MANGESLTSPLLLTGRNQSLSFSDMEQKTQRRGHVLKVGVLGTGNFATSFTRRLVSKGYPVVIGSRRPSARRGTLNRDGNCLCGVKVTTIPECIRSCDVIVLAIHVENFGDALLPFSEMLRGKILVDVSNREKRYASRSNSEYLSSLLPRANVVKAFNTISAQLVENDNHISSTVSGGQNVFVAGDDKLARHTVSDLARSLGFQAVDFGALKNAVQLEDFVLKVFPGWKIPICLAFGIFNVWSLYLVYIYFVDKTAYMWEQIFLKVLNKSVCMTAISMLALTFMPGQLASVLQAWRGTKHSQFPGFLDTWLKSKKQFGLIAFFLVAFHAIASALMLSPTYYRSWFHHPVVVYTPDNATGVLSTHSLPVPPTSWMVWKGELALLFGISAFLSMAVQAITSIPSVGSILNWSEWRCVQAKLGTFVLILSSCHVISMGAPGWLKNGPINALGSITFLSLVLPVLVLLMKFIFRCPPLFCYIRKIRRGWERERPVSNNSHDEKENSAKNKNGYSDSDCGVGLLRKKKPNNKTYEPGFHSLELEQQKDGEIVSECEKLVGLDIEDEVRSCCKGKDRHGDDRSNKNGGGASSSSTSSSRSCGCNGQFENDRSNCSANNILGAGGRCGCGDVYRGDGDNSKNKNYVRFAVNTNCDCSSV